MKDLNRLKELVIEKVDLAQVLEDNGADFIFDPGNADEVQYRCPVHGKDNKPSARFYRSTKSCYCWVCQKKWDVISLIRDKRGLNYASALMYLVNEYHVDISSIPNTPDLRPVKPLTPGQEKLQEMQENAAVLSLRGNIKEFRGKIPLEKYAALCYAFYMVLFDRFKDRDSTVNIKRLESKIKEIKYG